MSADPTPRRLQIVDGAGVLGAIFAALCCAGTPVVVGALGVLGLGFLGRDAILWPLMLGSLLVALWGFWRGTRLHRNAGPVVLAVLGAVSLSCGVIIVHGPPAMTMIYAGAVALVVATIWNVGARLAIPLGHAEAAAKAKPATLRPDVAEVAFRVFSEAIGEAPKTLVVGQFGP